MEAEHDPEKISGVHREQDSRRLSVLIAVSVRRSRRSGGRARRILVEGEEYGGCFVEVIGGGVDEVGKSSRRGRS